MPNINRHKVFVSYYHHDDQKYKNYLCDYLNPICNLFDDYSVCNGDIDDERLTDEQIRVIIRDQYIRDATVLVLLCGPNTKKRKHVDWELHAAMYDSEKNPRMGIVVVNLPESHNCIRFGDIADKPILDHGQLGWHRIESRVDYESEFPDMPSRIIDCFVEKDSPISVIDWGEVEIDPMKLVRLIDNAYQRRKTIEYSFSAPLRRHNS